MELVHSTPKASFKRKQPDRSSSEDLQATSRLKNIFSQTTNTESFHGFTTSEIQPKTHEEASDSSSDVYSSVVNLEVPEVSAIPTEPDPATLIGNTSESSTIEDPDIVSAENYIDRTYNTLVGQSKKAFNSSLTVKTRRYSSPYLGPNNTRKPIPSITVDPSSTQVEIMTNATSNIKNELIEAFESTSFKDVLQKTVNTALEAKIDPILVTLAGNSEEITNIDDRVKKLEQKVRSNNLIISGIPEGEHEDLVQKVIDICGYLNVTLSKYDITECLRLGRYLPNNLKPRRVMVQFLNKLARNDVFLNRGALKKFPTPNIFISEDLSPASATLFYHCRQRSKHLKLYSCYTKYGCCYIKADRVSKPVRITNLSDLNQYFPEPNHHISGNNIMQMP
jgi:hypothetical protein